MIQTAINSPGWQMNGERSIVAFRSAKVRECLSTCTSLATFAELKATLVPPQIRRCPMTAQSFCVPIADIAAQGYDLSLNRYKEVIHEEVDHRPPLQILSELDRLEEEIQSGMKELRGMLK